MIQKVPSPVSRTALPPLFLAMEDMECRNRTGRSLLLNI